MGVDVHRMLPVDIVAALRGFGRRWHTALAPLDEDDDRAHRIGPDGVSAVDLANDTVATLAALRRVLDDVLVHDDPVVLGALLDPSLRHFEGLVVDDTDEVLALLALEADGFAERADRVSTGEWNRTGRASGGGSVTALDVAREAVRTAADNLRAAERAMR